MRRLLSLSFAVLTFWSAMADILRSEEIGRPGALRGGGHVIVFRHGATNRDEADTDPLHPENVAAQRQLTPGGRAQAAQTGAAMHRLEIPVSTIITSQFQRAIETGTLLGFGEVHASADVTEGGLVVSPDENSRRAAALRKLAATTPAYGANLVIVTHKPNLMDAFGKDLFDVGEGEACVFKPDGQGGYRLLLRIPAGDWERLTATTH